MEVLALFRERVASRDIGQNNRSQVVLSIPPLLLSASFDTSVIWKSMHGQIKSREDEDVFEFRGRDTH